MVDTQELKKDVAEVIEAFNKGHFMRSPHSQRLADIITKQDSQIESLSLQLEEVKKVLKIIKG